MFPVLVPLTIIEAPLLRTTLALDSLSKLPITSMFEPSKTVRELLVLTLRFVWAAILE